MYRLLKPITSAQQTLLDEVQAHIKTQGLDAISGLKGDTVRNEVVVLGRLVLFGTYILMNFEYVHEFFDSIRHCFQKFLRQLFL